MEPQAGDIEHSPVWSGSDGSQELCPSGSYNEEDDSESEYPSDTQNAQISLSGSTECLQMQNRKPADGEGPFLDHGEKEVSVSYQVNDDFYLSESIESMTESPNIQTSQIAATPPPELPESKSWEHSPSSSSSLGCAADMTKALTLSSKRPQGASDRHGPGTENRRVESSEEGGSSEAPPASVFFGISDEGAEQAEKRNLGSDRDLCRPNKQRARYTRLSHKESQSEKHVKDTKSKCKRIAQLLANAPNPQNKGALLFKKRRQRVKKYTLVSYGTGFPSFDNSCQTEGETDQDRSVGYTFLGSSDSDFEEQYLQLYQHHNTRFNWRSGQDMDVLPETKGKGLLMFAQRRKRMDELVSEQEEEMNERFVGDILKETDQTRAQSINESKEMYMHAEETNMRNASQKKHMDYHGDIQEVNHLSSALKPMVSNRTAKPFLGFQDNSTLEPFTMSGGVSPSMKKHELTFKVPVPINSNPKVWSPTGDIIASRDERISVPAIKTGILPESKRKTANKHQSAKESELYSQSKGERKSYIESEEDCFSLGAEACNFMQSKPIKLKNPPPVAPKPTINPACPPWIRKSPSNDPYIPSRSPVPQPSHSPVGLRGQHYLQQQDWAGPQQMAQHWAPDQTEASLQTPAHARVPVNSSSQFNLQPTANSWSQQPARPPVSKQAHSPIYSPLSHSKNKSDSNPNLVVSCPPQAEKSYPQLSKSLEVYPKLRIPVRGVVQTDDGPTMAGKGAQLFAKRQSRMEKFVIDDETVQANKTRSPSPTSSLPNSWRYSSNIRAPPPLSYNPLLSPFHPPSAAKQAPSTSPITKPKSQEKAKSTPKQLNALDIMKHQPYQLDSSLFTYDAASEAKSPSPKPTPVSKFEVTKSLKQRADSSYSPYNPSEPAGQSKAEAPAKAPKLVSPPNSYTQSIQTAEPLSTSKHLGERLAVTSAAPRTSSKQTHSSRPASASSQSSSFSDSIASAFSPASLIARGVRQMAPRPKFSAKKPTVSGKQWKPVAMLSSV
ncbi:PREDICTED: synaptopodin-2-like isoform X1 [Cyprinodon variegatus]|uniref:synaptopodin-2-like isoform X1 n=1 Tax=Cyprinodon variegatus TaxID=28743 RepID=UPI0007429CEB|nr:PREDICTED: synaptopodin-2-like isoform X1 [Cyprinodon variegatus]